MTATDVLRRMLDEHGVEHKDFFDQTWWEDSDGAAYIAVETRPFDNNNPSTKLMLKRTATPAQAIAATLGSCNCPNNCTNGERTNGTCEADETDLIPFVRADSGDFKVDYIHVMECTECGHVYEHVNGDYEFCPRCGRKRRDVEE